MKIPLAARRLGKQVRENLGRGDDTELGRATMTPIGDVDGFGYRRTVEFDERASAYLRKWEPALRDDPRVIGFWETEGLVRVTFIGSIAADLDYDFPLGDEALLEEPESETVETEASEPESEPELTPAQKRKATLAAKKAAASAS